MRVWERARGLVTLCGNCAKHVREGEPIQLIKFDSLMRRLIRCRECADGPVDVDQLERFDVAEEGRRVIRPTLTTPTRLRDIKPLFDPKMAAAGDRE